MNSTESPKSTKSLSDEITGSPMDQSLMGGSQYEEKPEDRKIEKIRDLLFGAQREEFEQRLSAVKRRLWEENRALEAEVSHYLHELQNQMNEKMAKVTAEIEDVQDKGIASRKNVKIIIEQLKETLEFQFSVLRSQTIQHYSLLEGSFNQKT